MSKKTLFITLDRTHVFRNLFLQSNNIVEQLAVDKNLRIIVLTSDALINQLKQRVNLPNVFFEVIDRWQPTTFFELMLYRFFSYLLFTSTTKQLATFGVRPDVKTPLRARIMWPLMALNANTFGRSVFFKKQMVPWLYRKFYNTHPYSQVFDKYKPDHVFLTDTAFFPDLEILREAQDRDITTTAMTSNWDHLNKYYIPLKSDTFLGMNDTLKREAIKLQNYNEDSIKVVGFPQFDTYANPKSWLFSRDDFLRTLGMPIDSRVILLFSGSVYWLDENDVIKEIAKWARNGAFGKHVYILVRTYPGRRDTEKFSDFGEDKNVIFNSLDTSFNLKNSEYYANIIYHADVMISMYSTTALEAAIFDCPILTIGFDGHHKRPKFQSIKRVENMSHIRNILDTGCMPVTYSFSELKQQLSSYLTDKTLDADKRRKLVNKMCYKIDGKSRERIVKHLLEQLKD